MSHCCAAIMTSRGKHVPNATIVNPQFILYANKQWPLHSQENSQLYRFHPPSFAEGTDEEFLPDSDKANRLGEATTHQKPR